MNYGCRGLGSAWVCAAPGAVGSAAPLAAAGLPANFVKR